MWGGDVTKRERVVPPSGYQTRMVRTVERAYESYVNGLHADAWLKPEACCERETVDSLVQ